MFLPGVRFSISTHTHQRRHVRHAIESATIRPYLSPPCTQHRPSRLLYGITHPRLPGTLLHVRSSSRASRAPITRASLAVRVPCCRHELRPRRPQSQKLRMRQTQMATVSASTAWRLPHRDRQRWVPPQPRRSRAWRWRQPLQRLVRHWPLQRQTSGWVPPLQRWESVPHCRWWRQRQTCRRWQPALQRWALVLRCRRQRWAWVRRCHYPRSHQRQVALPRRRRQRQSWVCRQNYRMRCHR